MKSGSDGAGRVAGEDAVRGELIGFFVELAHALNLPKSVGEIYGLLFVSEAPLAMDDIVGRLGISVGSASQGLRLLRGFGAVRSVYIAGQRRDHYVAEVELRLLAAGYLRERILPELKRGGERLRSILGEVRGTGRGRRRRAGAGLEPFLAGRLERLDRWHSMAAGLIPAVSRIVLGRISR